MSVTPPAGYIVSPDCPPQAGAITPSGVEPQILGSSEVSETETLADGSCAGNPYYLQFNVMNGEPFVFNNNIPLTRIAGALTNHLFMPVVVHDGAPTGGTGQAEETPTLPTLEHPLFLPLIAQEAQITASGRPAPIAVAPSATAVITDDLSTDAGEADVESAEDSNEAADAQAAGPHPSSGTEADAASEPSSQDSDEAESSVAPTPTPVATPATPAEVQGGQGAAVTHVILLPLAARP
ncbi:MAG: hypothetical protein R3A44_00030 [Caldilineaceae bacterium]